MDKFKELVAQYQVSETGSSLLVNEPLEQHASEGRKQERKALKIKHRALLQLAAAVDPSLILEDKESGESWSRPAHRPSRLETHTEEELGFSRHFLPNYLLTDIAKTEELAFKVDRLSGFRTPISFYEQPKERPVYTSSFEPADNARFPQSRLSDQSTKRLAEKVGLTSWTPKSSGECRMPEKVVQDIAVRARTSSHGTALIEHLLRIIKVFTLDSRESSEKGSAAWTRAQMCSDVVDRVSDILQQVNLQSLQTVLASTLTLRTAQLFPFKNILPESDREKLRSATLLSSKILPSEAVDQAIHDFRERSDLDAHRTLGITMQKAMSAGRNMPNQAKADPTKFRDNAPRGGGGPSRGGGRGGGGSRGRGRGRGNYTDSGSSKVDWNQNRGDWNNNNTNRGRGGSNRGRGGYRGGGYRGGGYRGGGNKNSRGGGSYGGYRGKKGF